MLHRRPKVLGCIGCEMAEKEIAGLHAQILALEAERDALRAENTALRHALYSAGEWIVGAEVSTELGWEGSTRHILSKIEGALANTPAPEQPATPAQIRAAMAHGDD